MLLALKDHRQDRLLLGHLNNYITLKLFNKSTELSHLEASEEDRTSDERI